MDASIQELEGLATVNFFITGEKLRTIALYCQGFGFWYNGTIRTDRGWTLDLGVIIKLKLFSTLANLCGTCIMDSFESETGVDGHRGRYMHKLKLFSDRPTKTANFFLTPAHKMKTKAHTNGSENLSIPLEMLCNALICGRAQSLRLKHYKYPAKLQTIMRIILIFTSFRLDFRSIFVVLWS